MVSSARVSYLSAHRGRDLSIRIGLLNIATICSFSPLPKSSNPDRVISNALLYDFELDAEDMSRIDALDRGKDGAISWNPVDAE